MLRCAILDDYQDAASTFGPWNRLTGRVEITVFRDHIESAEELAAALQPFEIIVVMRERTPVDRALLERLANLRLIVTTGRKNAAIDLAAAMDRGIVVCGTDGLDTTTPELTFALILALARQLHVELPAMRSGGPWQSSVGYDLAGATLGIIGLGRLGTRVAAIAQAFGMRLTAWSPNLTAERCAAVGASLATSLEQLLATSDFVTIHMPLSQRSRGLLGAAQLAHMKPTSFLINTSRGPIVDEAALVATLEDGRIAGAGVDVFDREPLPPSHPFRHLPNVVATPHIGYVTRNNYRAYFTGVVDDIAAWLDGAPRNVLATE